jgi:hypothetical protein
VDPIALVLALLAWPHAADVERLGHRDFHTRDAAHTRLEAAGWRAWPALLAAKPASPEAAMRVERLSAAMPDVERIAAKVLLGTDPAEEVQSNLAAWFAADPDRLARLGEKLDQVGQLKPCIQNAQTWIEQKPYLRGSIAGDCLELVRRHRRAMKMPPPKQMPAPGQL